MASESSEDLTVSVELPANLVEWLDEEATAADVDRETAIAQLLASYQAVTQLNGDVDHDVAEFDTRSILDSVEDAMAEKVETEVERAVDTDSEREFRADIEDRLDAVEDEMSSFQSRLSSVDDRIDTLDAEFQEKLTDVRKRVVQVKNEAETKAPEDHTHAELEGISELHDEIESLSAEIAQVRSEYEEAVADQTDHAERLDELQERLQTVAWVVKDLRDERNSGGLDAVDRIKHAAAQAGIESANCENCTETINISLMTEPRCPHCEATLSNVEPASGWFGSAKLTVPSQLESGENDE
jgi:chromosome segregation ATPase